MRSTAVTRLVIAGVLATACAAPQSTPAPSPTPTLPPTPIATAPPTATPTPNSTALPASGIVSPGRYYVDAGGYRYTFTIAAGTTWNRGGDGAPDVLITHDPDGADFAVMWLWGPLSATDTIYHDPCHWRGTAFTPGPSVADYASAITTIAAWHATQPTDVTVGGRQGKRLQLTVPADANFATCDGGQLHLSPDRWFQAAGQTEDMRILDFDGARYLIITSWFATTPAEIRMELDQMVQSMAIDKL